MEYATRPAITIDGLPIDPGLVPLIVSVEVDDHAHLPDMFVILLSDRDGEALASSRARIGSAIRISGTAMGERSETLLIHGEVTALEAEYGSHGASVVIRGYDHSHRLIGVNRTETYRDVTDSDIARKIAQRAGVDPGTLEESSIRHVHISQVDISDWAFLKSRAREIGFDVAVVDGKLDFRRPPEASAAPGEGDLASHQPQQLVWGSNLLSFHPRVTASEQVREVEVRGWDPARKEAVIGQATASTRAVQVEDTPASLAATSGRERWVGVGRALSQQSEVDEAATAEAERIASAHAQAEGEAFGNPALKAGSAVSIGGVGRTFSGRYVLTHTRHRFDGEGYRTRFEVTGRQDRSLLGLVSAGASNGARPGGAAPIVGFVVALVTDNADPEDLGRVKLKFPTFHDDYESDWARVVQVGAGPDSGIVFLPDVNDEVLVGFEAGDIRRPYVIGGLWNGRDKPPLGDSLFDNGHVRRRGMVSRAGHRFVFFDDANQSGVGLLTEDDSIRIAMNQTDSHLSMNSRGSASVVAGDITLEAGGDITIKASGTLTLEGSGSVKLKSGGIVDIDGSLIQLN